MRARRRRGCLCSTLLIRCTLLASGWIQPARALFGVGEQRFQLEGLINIGSLGLNGTDGLLAAVGDVDGEQL